MWDPLQNTYNVPIIIDVNECTDSYIQYIWWIQLEGLKVPAGTDNNKKTPPQEQNLTRCIITVGFFTPELADSLSMESEWQQDNRAFMTIQADLNNGPYDLDSSSEFLFLQSLFNLNPWGLFLVFQLQLITPSSSRFQLNDKVQDFVSLFAFFHFYSVVHWNSKVHQIKSFLFVN